MRLGTARYDIIGEGYADHRREDPRIAEAIASALGDARNVVNIGAGTGSYEGVGRSVIAVEPSTVMIHQRSRDAAAVVQATAERLPFATDAFDAAMTLLSMHHWGDWRTGLNEMCRVAARRVIWTFDPAAQADIWVVSEYFPGAAFAPGCCDAPPVDDVAQLVDATRVEPLLIPADCTDLFGTASWNRPENYLDDGVCQATSMLAQLPAEEVQEGRRRLANDLRSGRWHQRHADLLELDAYDAGHRLVISGG